MWSVNLGVPANAFSDSFSKDKLTWRLALDQKFSAGVMGYVSYNRGYKSGGFNLLDVGALNRPTGHVSPSYTPARSEEHTSELQSLMRISYAVFCLKKKTPKTQPQIR